MQKDETKEVEMDFPEDFKVEALAGKKAIYEIKVIDIREKILQEMEEAFFESMRVKMRKHFVNKSKDNRAKKRMKLLMEIVSKLLII